MIQGLEYEVIHGARGGLDCSSANRTRRREEGEEGEEEEEREEGCIAIRVDGVLVVVVGNELS